MANWPPPYNLQGAPSISSAVGAQSAASILAGGDYQPSSSVTSPSARGSRAPSAGPPGPAPSLSSHAPANSTASAGSMEASAASTSRPPSAKRKRKEAAPKPEKRLARYISSPNMKVLEKMQRAFTHRLYLIERDWPESSEAMLEYKVLGATGNVYTVTLGRVPSCTCPDAAKGNTCKHWLFVLLRVLKLSRDDPRVWQKALLSAELADLLEKDKAAQDETAAAGLLASAVVRRRYHEVVGTSEGTKEQAEELLGSVQRPLEGDCPICFEELAPESQASGAAGEPVVFCHTCGNNIHRDCFARWSHSKPKGQVTCVYCRAKWVGEGPVIAEGAAEATNGEYLNLAAYSNEHQDVSMESLYPSTYEWIGRPRGGRRSWGYR